MGMFQNFFRSAEGFFSGILVMLTLLSPVFLHNKFFTEYAPEIFVDIFQYLSDHAAWIFSFVIILYVYRRIKSTKVLVIVGIIIFLIISALLGAMSGGA